jgi:Zn finger protein HypA/HybF involved in hydrogenase expression
MTMDVLHTDGNEVAGVLADVLAVDPTRVRRRCQSCRDEQPLAAHLAFHGAGIVLRCPSCDDVAVRIGVQGDHLTVEWRGTYRIDIARDAQVARV